MISHKITKHSPRNSNWKEPELSVFLADFVWLQKITANTQKLLYSVQVRNKLVSTLFWLIKPLPYLSRLSEKNCKRSLYVVWQTSRMESFLVVNPFRITDLFCHPLKTSGGFQGVSKVISGMKWVNYCCKTRNMRC